jgi:NADH-quinone oxidoreductase subunit G
MAKITINGKIIEVEDGIPLIKACELAEVEIPRFCYHDRLRVAGNCRMCLVEVEKAPKPVASCAAVVTDGMVVKTDSPLVKKAREGVMEFLLINHPLDCPICDQGGECDLQDQAFKYGRGENRFSENKRAVKDKYMGPLIDTHMTRCIHCTRCVRFMNDIAGVPEMGALGRGENMSITSYLEKSITSELSGNIIDVCPVGALNSKPYAYTSRSWELKKTQSIDVFDAMGSNIRIDSRGLEVMRILPAINDDINEEWISDKTRFSYDGLKIQRIDRAYIRSSGRLVESSMSDAIDVVVNKMKDAGSKVGAIAGDMTDCETLISTKKLIDKMGSKHIDFNQYNYYFDSSKRGNYLFGSSFAALEEADFVLLVGANIRKNAPVLSARLNKLARFCGLKIARIGESDDQTFPLQELGDSAKLIKDILSGSSDICKSIQGFKKPVIIVGSDIYSREDASMIMKDLEEIAKKYGFIQDSWNGFSVLLNEASAAGSLDFGFYAEDSSLCASSMAKKIENGDLDLLFLLGADDIEIPKVRKGFVVYIGHHGDRNAAISDVVLPAAAFTEKNSLFVNNEGVLQSTTAAVQAIGKAMIDSEIIIKIAKGLGLENFFENHEQIREYIVLKHQKISSQNLEVLFRDVKSKKGEAKIKSKKFNFYHTNVISRASKTMAACTKEIISFNKLDGSEAEINNDIDSKMLNDITQKNSEAKAV